MTPDDPSSIEQDGQPHPMTMGFPLYDYASVPRPIEGLRRHMSVLSIPPGLQDTLAMVAIVSEAPDNTVLVLAGRPSPDASWRLYVDLDNDDRIDEAEYVLTAETEDDNRGQPHKAARATVDVAYDALAGDEVVTRQMRAEVIWVQNAVGVQSTVRYGTPLFLFDADVSLVTGTLTVGDTTLRIGLRAFRDGYYPPFRGYTEVLLDRDWDGRFDVSRGSSERYKPDESFQVAGHEVRLDGIAPDGSWAQFRTLSVGTGARPVLSSRRGEAPPTWEAVDLDGDSLRSSDARGRYILLDFWASWCSPCVAELPHLRSALERYGSERLVVVGMATMDGEGAVRSAVAARDITWPVVYDAGDAIASAFRVVSLPDPILVGPDGQILERGKALRGLQLEETLSLYLGD